LTARGCATRRAASVSIQAASRASRSALNLALAISIAIDFFRIFPAHAENDWQSPHRYPRAASQKPPEQGFPPPLWGRSDNLISWLIAAYNGIAFACMEDRATLGSDPSAMQDFTRCRKASCTTTGRLFLQHPCVWKIQSDKPIQVQATNEGFSVMVDNIGHRFVATTTLVV
jgi:hypothetical protein